jgi:hypothetical protein
MVIFYGGQRIGIRQMMSKYIATLKEEFICNLPELYPLHIQHEISTHGIQVEIFKSFLTIDGAYSFNMCSPKWIKGNFVIGTWDGRRIPFDTSLPVLDFKVKHYGYRQLTLASFVHDILCQWLKAWAHAAHLSLLEFRHIADKIFRRLAIESGFKYVETYYTGLKLYGALRYE